MSFSILCLFLLMVLVAACTLAQVRLGTFGAVSMYIRSVWVYWTPEGSRLHIPVFPGGGLVGFLLLVNLIVVQYGRLELSWRKAGIWAIHLGLIFLFVGEFVTGFFQVDSQMAIDKGATRNYAESPREVELAVVDSSPKDYDEVLAFPGSYLRDGRLIEHKKLPFSLLIKKYYANSSSARRVPVRGGLPSMATEGVGRDMAVFERPPTTQDDQVNQAAAFVEVLSGDRSLGTWLLSTEIGGLQSFTYMDRVYRLAVRPKRRYMPFTLTLKEFRHEVHTRTDIPRLFSSLVRLRDPRSGERRDVLISMNQPLRYDGKTFYQASFGKNDTMSVLEVVENPGRTLPYISCVMVGLGLLFHFLLRLKPMWSRS